MNALAVPGNEHSVAIPQQRLFMENKGQVHGPKSEQLPQVLYHLSGNGINVSLTAHSIQYTFFRSMAMNSGKDLAYDPKVSTSPEFKVLGLELSLIGNNPSPLITAEQQQPYYTNYYVQGCGERGAAFVYGCSKVVYHDIYPNIDWQVYLPVDGSASVKYDFVVRPGGDPALIKLRYGSTGTVSKKSNGSVLVTTDLGTLQEKPPYTYLKESGTVVPSAFVQNGNEMGFAVSASPGKTIVIDPQVVWATYYGGNQLDVGQNVGVTEGNIFVCGQTTSTSNLATPGSYCATYNGTGDAFLAKFDPAGRLLWSTYYGGPNLERCWAMAIDTANGYVYVGGQTFSASGMATSGSFQTVLNAGLSLTAPDGFLAKFSRGSGVLSWATYYGGSNLDGITAATCDTLGNLYITGYTFSSGLATTGSHKSTFQYSIDSTDVFLAKFDPGGNRVWGTYFGGSSNEESVGLCTDRQGNVFITGDTYSKTSIATSGSFLSSKTDFGMDAFLAKFSTSGTLLWSTYYGSPNVLTTKYDDYGQSVVCDNRGNVYLCGTTASPNMATPGAFQTIYGGGINDAFVVKFSSAGTRRWATYYGGSGFDNAYNGMGGTVAPFDYSGQITPRWSIGYAHEKLWLAGHTSSKTGISTTNSFKDTLSGTIDALVASFDTSGNRLWATYYGGSDREFSYGIAVTDSREIYVTGITASSNDIATASAFQPSLNNFYDGFLLHLVDSPSRLRLTGAHPYCEGDTFTVGIYITAHGSQRSGNSFSVQLSNASGSFSSPTVIGTASSTIGTSIFCTLPGGISGAGYKMRIVSSAPLMISDTVVALINPLPSTPVITQSGNVLSTGTYAAYQWYKSGVIIQGATSKSYTPTATGQYTVMVKSAAGCFATSAPFGTTVNVSNVFMLSDVMVYPNPTSGVIVIENAPDSAQAALRNMLGQTLALFQLSVQHQEISLLDQPAGIYMLYISASNGQSRNIRIAKH
jgi:hypothetical protein